MADSPGLRVTCGAHTERVARSVEWVIPAGTTVAIALAEGGHWYGHGFNHRQPYPLELGAIDNPAFAVNNIQCPLWLASTGFAVWADTAAALAVQLNTGGDGLLRIACPGHPWRLVIRRGDNLPAVHRALLRELGWPPPPPPQAPGECFFCTWTQYPRCLTQERILDMARQIRAEGYPCRTLIIDDRWESCFGELTFGPQIPDPAGLVRELHALDFQVWLWVTPFVNEDATTFAPLAAERVLVPHRDGTGAARLKWWGGTAGLVDLTNPAGRDWLLTQLRRLRADYGVDGFKIDGGDAKYHPPPATAAWHREVRASGYADLLLALVEEVAPHACETRTAWRSQGRRILWREGGKDSHWGLDNGLAALVTLGLHLGLLGYDLLIPDMVPGRVQTMNAADPLPSDELLVRWTEASALFPLLQFSYLPWQYAPATAAAVRGWAAVHHALDGYLREQWTNRTAPLLRPIWYDDPGRDPLWTRADEWLLGDALLAAPVVRPGVTHRTVELPAGQWVDAWTGTAYPAGTLADFPAPCPGMPLFVRAERADLLAALRPVLATLVRGSVPTGVTTATYQAGLDRDLKVTG